MPSACGRVSPASSLLLPLLVCRRCSKSAHSCRVGMQRHTSGKNSTTLSKVAAALLVLTAPDDEDVDVDSLR